MEENVKMNALTAPLFIEDIISVLDGVAFQNSIFALNASFVPVSNKERLRDLAYRSAALAIEIRTLFEGTFHEITQGGLQVSRAEVAIAELVTMVHQVNNIVGDIANASDEQRRSIEQINIAVTQLDQSTHRNSSMAVESSRAAHVLETQIEILANSIGVLRLGQQALSAKLLNQL